MTAAETHRRLFLLIQRHGTPEEVAEMREVVEMMREWRLGFEGSYYEPMDEVRLPGFLIRRAAIVAKERHEKAKEYALRNQHGIVRHIIDETRAVQGQYAACLMLGIEFASIPRTHTSSKAHGNLGENRSAFIPKPGSFGLLVPEDEPASRTLFLIQEVGGNTFACGGFVRAGEVQLEQYQRTFVRNGATAKPYLVPSDKLHPLREWFRD